ncbi:hypothetical protein EK904_001392 [Melospiza melodia maxima]|nr:hypothetical protein EK904_001392 [Melospiza melodia maxima]
MSQVEVIRTCITEGKRKALSTCGTQITVVSLIFIPCILTYAQPYKKSPGDKVVSVVFTVVTPMLNPMIYTLRNTEMKKAIRRTLGKIFLSAGKQKLERTADPKGDPQDAGDDAGVGQQDEAEGREDDEHGGRDQLPLVARRVRAREQHQRRDVTEEVVDAPGPTEGQGEHPGCLHHRYHLATAAGEQHHGEASPGAHDGWVPQRAAHGHVAVVGHGCQQVPLSGRQENHTVELCDTAQVGDAPVL